MSLSEAEFFTSGLMSWWKLNRRQLPWKETRDPYKIWLSEIILQQTTIRQGTPYYLRFVEKFPDIGSLAVAEPEEVYKMWEGLGYYNRAKNMHATAQHIYHELDSVFPDDYHDLLKLKGIGPYTGAAIASFAYEKPFPVIDGNVIRLISRFLGLQSPANSPILNSEIKKFLTESIQFAMPSEFNQALMDFGSVKCVPRNPECHTCPLSSRCMAFQKDWVHVLPVKPIKKARKNIFYHFIEIVINDHFVVLQQRDKNDIWPDLFQFPVVETNKITEEQITQMLNDILLSTWQPISKMVKVCEKKQTLTHRTVHGYFSKIHLTLNDVKINNRFYLVDFSKVRKFAFPKIMREYLDNHTDIS
jgi:A/G-specific adenine glycosylase